VQECEIGILKWTCGFDFVIQYIYIYKGSNFFSEMIFYTKFYLILYDLHS